ncbi:MAG: polyprenol monophosphomannose synthase [Acidobacteriota bacterium]|nr:polyprenol monophosphomannose synthase [Acidobacteriota bacterium]
MKTLVLIPTYNERDSLPPLVAELMAIPGIEAMIIDDGSPDGTGQVADGLSKAHPGRVGVMHRTGTRGLGRSYADGFRHAVSTDADLVVQMDADGSHDPRYLPAMLAAAADADVVVGSRYLRGISVVNWPLRRIILSSFANRYSRRITGLAVHDCTAGFRCWRREALARMPIDRLVSDGYAFQVEVTFLAAHLGLRIVETPIIFVERREGASKLSWRVVFEGVFTPWRLILRHGRLRARAARDAGYNSRGATR